MHQLFLLRHAKAAREAPTGSDHDRPLTPAGRTAAAAIGQAMRKAGLAPDVVLVSSAKRTQETLDELETAGVWDDRPNIDTLPTLYMATLTQIRDQLRDLPETVRSALVIGHNPGLHELALSLSGPLTYKPELSRLTEGYPTATLTEFLLATQWHKLSPASTSLHRILQPPT